MHFLLDERRSRAVARGYVQNFRLCGLAHCSVAPLFNPVCPMGPHPHLRPLGRQTPSPPEPLPPDRVPHCTRYSVPPPAPRLLCFTSRPPISVPFSPVLFLSPDGTRPPLRSSPKTCVRSARSQRGVTGERQCAGVWARIGGSKGYSPEGVQGRNPRGCAGKATEASTDVF